MKLVNYTSKEFFNAPRIGVIVENQIIDLHSAYRSMLLHQQEYDLVEAIDTLLPFNPDKFFTLGRVALSRAKDTYEFAQNNPQQVVYINRDQVVLGPPVPNPSKIICVGKNYKDHVNEMKEGSVPDYPVLFAKFTNALIGPEDAIEKSPQTEKLDYEAELAVVIGKQATNVTEQEALDYVVGFTIGNDTTARDIQKRTPQWLQGKSLDRTSPIGPWIVTLDEITKVDSMNIKSLVNGEVRQSSNTKYMIFDIRYLISFISNLITLNPGDIILTGTPDGVGFAMDPPQFLQAGDIVTIEIDGIGTLENRIVDAN